MNTTQMIGRSTERFDIPEQLSTAESKLVYLFVAASDGATVDDLQTSLNVRKITLFPVLDTLAERGLIDRVDDEYVTAS
ncbi:MAG: MarR family transcriptional regulator [Haloplanus sp.]